MLEALEPRLWQCSEFLFLLYISFIFIFFDFFNALTRTHIGLLAPVYIGLYVGDYGIPYFIYGGGHFAVVFVAVPVLPLILIK